MTLNNKRDATYVAKKSTTTGTLLFITFCLKSSVLWIFTISFLAEVAEKFRRNVEFLVICGLRIKVAIFLANILRKLLEATDKFEKE